jgi:hypothetical protein
VVWYSILGTESSVNVLVANEFAVLRGLA